MVVLCELSGSVAERPKSYVNAGETRVLNVFRYFVPRAMLTLLATSGAFALVFPKLAVAEDHPTIIDVDGTVHIHDLTIPPSNYWSPEFKNAYVKTVAMSQTHPFAQLPD